MKGSCACGTIGFEVTGSVSALSTCHCTQCRKMSGHVWASAQVVETGLEVTGPVKWFHLTDAARRGICPDCGAFLFWQGKGESEISFALGAVDGDTGLRLEKQIFAARKGDYYSLDPEVAIKP